MVFYMPTRATRLFAVLAVVAPYFFTEHIPSSWAARGGAAGLHLERLPAMRAFDAVIVALFVLEVGAGLFSVLVFTIGGQAHGAFAAVLVVDLFGQEFHTMTACP